MTEEYLLDVLGDIRGRYIAAAANNPARGRTANGSGRKRIVLIAALVALLAALALVACARDWFGLRSFIINRAGEREQIAEFGENHTTRNSDILSLQGYTDSPESMALHEWLLFLEGYDTDRAILEKTGNQPTGFEQEYGCYSVYTQEMADRLEEILKKYSLKKHRRLEVLSYEQLRDGVGGAFLDEAAHSRNYGYLYEDGNFHLDGNWSATEGNVSYQLIRSVKGTLTDTALFIGDADAYEQWPYRSGGYDMTLALAENFSLIIADLGDSFVFVNVLDGTEGKGMPEDTVLTKSLLERMADSFCWGVLAAVREPDFDKLLDAYPAETGVWDGEDILPQYKGYAEVLRQIHAQYAEYDLIYSLWDMDGDGERELLVLEGTCEADYQWNVYAHGASLETVRLIGEFSGSHSRLYAAESGGIWNMEGQMGVEWLTRITLKNERLESEAVIDGMLMAEYFIPSDLELPWNSITCLTPLAVGYSGPTAARDYRLPSQLR